MHYVFKVIGQLDLSRLCGIGLDETATRRGHHYVTIFVGMDRESPPGIFATPGKGKECLRTFAAYLKGQNGNPANVIKVVCDMSPAFLATAAEKTFSNAAVAVDWFHVVQIITRTVDEVRRLEAQDSHSPRGFDGQYSKAWSHGAAKNSLRPWRS